MIRINLITSSVAIFTMATLVTLVSCSNPNTKKEISEVTSASTFTGLDGAAVQLEDFKGKVVFLNYWATWCKPCIAEMPDIEKARQILAHEGVVFLAASDENISKIAAFKEKNDYQFTFIKLNVDFSEKQVYSLPTTVIYKPNGTIAHTITVAVDWSSPDMIEKIRSAKE